MKARRDQVRLEPPIRPTAMAMPRMEAAARTPIEPGTVDVQATVSLRVEVGP